MQFTTNNWYTIALDTDRQLFIATDKVHPELFATGITIEDAVAQLSNLEKHDNRQLA